MKTKTTAKRVAAKTKAIPTVSHLRLQKILVPVDFSECSWKALEYAVAFGRQFNAQILLFHAVALPPAPQFPMGDGMVAEPNPYNPDVMTQEAEQELKRWRDKTAHPELAITTAVLLGMAHQEIIRVATEKKIDLIVIGHRGRSGLAHFLLGSTAERVTRHAPCPVFLVREHEHDFLVSPRNERVR